MKRVIAANIDRILEFDSPEEAKTYLDGLKAAGKKFRVVWDCDVGGGKKDIRIQEQYNKNPMIED